jgi:hypothetical protein
VLTLSYRVLGLFAGTGMVNSAGQAGGELLAGRGVNAVRSPSFRRLIAGSTNQRPSNSKTGTDLLLAASLSVDLHAR